MTRHSIMEGWRTPTPSSTEVERNLTPGSLRSNRNCTHYRPLSQMTTSTLSMNCFMVAKLFSLPFLPFDCLHMGCKSYPTTSDAALAGCYAAVACHLRLKSETVTCSKPPTAPHSYLAPTNLIPRLSSARIVKSALLSVERKLRGSKRRGFR